MYLQKKLQILLVLFSLLFFVGCIKKFDGDGLTLKIQESELNNFSQEFPIRQDFVVANMELQKPHLFIKDGTNRISANINLNISAIFMPNSNGTLTFSGIPYFDKEKSAIYLKDIELDELKMTNLNIDKTILDTIVANTKPIVDNIFNTIPVYKIDKSSFKGSFVKDVKIEDSELLVTFGL
ncbi:MAG: DUF1439 domain-containing protein [Arcobacter sp.]|jgi:hypothetical protein|uniref:DUF1439 domain-containing protein n=1 Tax=Arcobacter sp. TaxID=1872629 RepID=UPI002A762307|nr:DUF1439 domain-containing protein [Arcobacter sp.]MDY3200637.1 DUF1439 domain-containing protein [Arcobacter sp.]